MKKLILLFLILTGCCQKDNPVNPQGGTSQISYIQKVTNGVVFFEGFENDNFVSADNWTVLQGVPGNTSSQYKVGIKSWDNTANSQSIPVAKQVILDNNVGTWMSQVWFYDDISFTNSTTYPGPYFKIKTSDGKFMQVGVRNGTSTTKYVCSAMDVYTEDTFGTTTSVNRSTGWHLLTIIGAKTASVNPSIYIDGTNVLANTIVNNTLSELYLCADVVGGTNQSFGYFDNSAYYRSIFFTINGDSGSAQLINLFNLSNVNLGSAPTISFNPFLQRGPFPINAYIQASSASSATIFGYQSAILQANPGDVYRYSLIDFGRKFTTMQMTDNALANQNITAQGVREVINFGLQDAHTFEIDQLEGTQWKQKSDNFFYYARQGGQFGVNVDSINDNAFGTVLSFKQGGTNNRVFLLPNFSSNPTDQFAVGNKFTIQNQSNQNKQIATLSSKDTNSLTFIENLNFDVNQGDYIYSQYLFPFQQLPNQSLTGFQQVNSQNVRYTWTIPTQDYIQA